MTPCSSPARRSSPAEALQACSMSSNARRRVHTAPELIPRTAVSATQYLRSSGVRPRGAG